MFCKGLGLRRPVVRLRDDCLGVEVWEAALDRFHHGLEINANAAVVDRVVQRFRVYASELAELISAKHGNRLAHVTLTDITPEHIDTLLVDLECVEHQKAAQPAVERVRVYLIAVLQELHAGR